MKHRIKAKYYLRYADDFAVFSTDKEYLETILPKMQEVSRHKKVDVLLGYLRSAELFDDQAGEVFL